MKVTLEIPDMMCDGCVETVRAALSRVGGVQGADVSLESKQANVAVEAGTEVHELVEAVKAAGYSARRAAS